MAALFQRQQITSKFSLGAMLLSPAMVASLRKELRRAFPGIKVEEGFLRTMLETEVLKREVVESDEAKQAANLLKKANRSASRGRGKIEATIEAPAIGLTPRSEISVPPGGAPSVD